MSAAASQIQRRSVATSGIHEGPLPKGGEGMRVSGSARWCALAHAAGRTAVAAGMSVVAGRTNNRRAA
jgi:hypothetical protein